MTSKQPLPEDWMHYLDQEFQQPYMLELKAFLRDQKDQGKIIYPHSSRWFHAFWQTPLDRVKVVILGQDPYHGPGQAEGLSFSVPPGVRVPPSLQNIYKEQASDLGIQPPGHGCLVSWAREGVLLLNAVLTVEAGQAGSHQGKGWETFTDRVIDLLNQQSRGLVFLLWGGYARKKAGFVDRSKHLVLEAPHPSPLSAHRGFLGCRHFSQANAWLQARQEKPINWQLPAEVS
ncbi:uracil-DNA glycosylase [Marinospirillum perlucidum]|uniref:uracil-DNA glycosylase n=1 Tax=Marinospirillum perlucidum TaxID=1982602 RepID=UPI000DF1674A|nr:uracil-DNA glycosylase [Marinospirillum perlucidum]